MAEYIERESLAADGWYLQRYISGDGYAYVQSMNILDIPAADVVPVRHGRWVVKGQDIYCSECNAESAYNPFGASKFSVYCPTCGALMDKDGDGDV